LPVKIYINASCTIREHHIYKNEQLIYKGSSTDLSGFLIAAYRHFSIDYPKFYKMDTLSKLGWLANEVLLQDSFDSTKYSPGDIGIVLSNANASLDTDIKYFDSSKTYASPALFVYTLPNIVIGEISIRHQFKGENAFFISDGFDAGFIEQYVSNLVNNNILQCCICGWVDLLGDRYQATLFLIEQDKTANSVNFTKENLKRIIESQILK
jgi:hypothetical protein